MVTVSRLVHQDTLSKIDQVTKCDRYYRIRQFYYKMPQFLQNASAHEAYLHQNKTHHAIGWYFITCFVLLIIRIMSKNL